MGLGKSPSFVDVVGVPVIPGVVNAGIAGFDGSSYFDRRILRNISGPSLDITKLAVTPQ